MPTTPVENLVKKIKRRRLDDGGFSEQELGSYRPDATSWAVLALDAAGVEPGIIDPARSRLTRSQLNDGRIIISSSHPEAYWPTPLAVLAWQGSKLFHQNLSLAVEFLLKNTGLHWKKEENDPIQHDTALRGWPWVEGTHSWIEPTSLSVIALNKAGYQDNQRFKEAVAMILDRQLPKGGWNYGNTIVFENELLPMVDLTGVSLNALSGQVAYNLIERSLIYLNNQIGVIRSPFSLGWAILGFGAWGKRPKNAENLIIDCLGREEKVGNFGTTSYCLLLLALKAKDGIGKAINQF
jgi:hypothetical protein